MKSGKARHAALTTPSFDRIARSYWWLELLSFGRTLRATREQYLPSLVEARRALVLGDGDGRFLAALLRGNPEIHAVAVDSSERMLQLLETRCQAAGARLVLRRGDLRTEAAELLPERETYDLVTSHFFLDCLQDAELAALARMVRERLQPGARWVVSEFRVPPRWPLRPFAKLLVRLLYVAFGLLTGLTVRSLPDHAATLMRAGFDLERQQLRLGGLLSAELWRLRDADSWQPPG